MKIAVIGSRTFKKKDFLYRSLDDLFANEALFKKIDLIISGGATGADTLASCYAEDRKIPTLIFLPEYGKYGKAAPLKRNNLIVEEADTVIAFWDSKSPGTRYSIDYAKKLRKEVLIIKI